jgi:hypothetical protein
VNKSKYLYFLLVLFICGGFLVGGVRGAAGQAASIRYVTPGGSDSGDCTYKSQPCRSIQYAVDKSGSGDEVRLAAGVYTTTETPIADIPIGLSLRGGYSTSNWDTANKTANPTSLKATCLWDSGEAAIVANTPGPVSIQDLDINGCGIRSGGELLVERVSILNGQIYHSAGANIPVTLTDVTITGGNFVHASGIDSTATLTRVVISNSPEAGIKENSGGKLVSSDIQILNCTGAGIRFANGSLPSSVTRGLVQGNGTGIETLSGGIVTLDQVTILNNEGRGVIDKSAGMVMKRVTIQGNHAIREDANDDPGDGGGYYTVGGKSSLTDVVIRGNSADGNGGGIYDKSGGLTIIRGRIAGNQAGQTGGGAWTMAKLTFFESAISGNQAPVGGGLFCNKCLLNLTNSAVSANTTGGIVVEQGILTLLNSLAAGNSGIGVEVLVDSVSATNFDNTLLALNTGGNCTASVSPIGTNNLSSDASCSFSGSPNWTQTNPKLGGLLTNGFYKMSASSPAVDHGNPATCPAIDYRGIPRPIDGNHDGVKVCDIGPLEVGFDIYLALIRR